MNERAIRHERSDVDLRAIGIGVASIVGAIVFTALLSYCLLREWNADPNGANTVHLTPVEGSSLQTAGPEDLKRYRAEKYPHRGESQ